MDVKYITACGLRASHILAPAIPQVGSTINIDSLGPAKVESICHHNPRLTNFIGLLLMETVVGQVRQKFPLSVRLKQT